ncbi:transposase [Geothrix sp.]|jgi:hypothetical protein|uniref:transposase n=1 Tax=Geothrix sp. TaxID=1962974 RepID=UPI0025BB96A0|nr:transposase [Geothrix sp.]
MKPKPRRTTSEQLVIGWKLDLALDPNHELVRLAAVIPWEDLTAEFGRMNVLDLGRPGIPVRLMAGLHLLKHTYGLSDEQVAKGWVAHLWALLRLLIGEVRRTISALIAFLEPQAGFRPLLISF